jgi:hypothetical protein
VQQPHRAGARQPAGAAAGVDGQCGGIDQRGDERTAGTPARQLLRQARQRSAFQGLYATGIADQTDNFGNRYSFGLEWELFDQGRGEARRTLDRLRLESKTQYVQLLRDMEDRQLQENLLAVEQMRNKLLATLYQREATAIRPCWSGASRSWPRAAPPGPTSPKWNTRPNAPPCAASTTGLRDVLVYPQSQELINRIEDVQLLPDDQLLARASERSPDLQLQGMLASATPTCPR